MSYEEERFYYPYGESSPEKQQPASLESKQELLVRINQEAIFGNEQTDDVLDIKPDGSMEASLVVSNNPEEDEFDDELDITLCPGGEVSINEPNELLAIVVHGWHSRAFQETDPVYHMYHFIDDPEGLKILKTSMEDSAESSTSAPYSLEEQDVEDLLREKVEEQYSADDLYKSTEIASEADVQHLLDLLSRAAPRGNEPFDYAQGMQHAVQKRVRVRSLKNVLHKLYNKLRNRSQ